ncbi:hypothetical protein [Arenimonas sp.]|uniref:hypothetical protein n=1 Tax=Arenimonas sp. TaxID=1872635 RepID=UPI0039E263FD
MNIEDRSIEELISDDAMRLRAQAPASSPLMAWHAVRERLAWRLARRLRWIGFGLLALVAIAMTPMLLRAPATIWWCLPLAAMLWPLLALADAPRRPDGERS